MTYLQPTSDAVVVNENMDTDELEQRRKAVQKFMARAEISMVRFECDDIMVSGDFWGCRVNA
jgi:hypothetical protein